MTARWRRSSRSGHAGDNCVEIAMSTRLNAKSIMLNPPQNGKGPRKDDLIRSHRAHPWDRL
ncbi:DUF397 domain-containing protein [Actinoallomurus iriomotensis]|uniref:DUF397 domain-containing protein n=1 Tax=Actinoallomurus iriomotensis TaxID=478107 RepID=A0A9W6S324_9ACTN|nr:hypothetical protein Airi01_014820 [Actinoallomurus iriomotensis]GLY84722.1 hypothetical protein Airi02_026510 [Actinoallomurus iriomotensis]